MRANAHICAGLRTTLCILTETQSLRYILRKGFLLAWISPNRLGWLSGTICLWPWNCKHISPHLSPLIKSRLDSKYVAKGGIVLLILLGLQVCTPHLVYPLLGTNPGLLHAGQAMYNLNYLWLRLFIFVYSCSQEGQKSLACASPFSDLRQTASSASCRSPWSLARCRLSSPTWSAMCSSKS